ncbi:putative F-box and JmjC domain protein [Rhizodiscina lignyota]|uniref:F-box and JmjC domain protein n=1 Tax=Rhizodiscina lignyota TaxID=1504668 RepID=A0A9P4MBD2_9PEZI|nr:putative F-box and JmjC domain protein [Rhizodiscina lignyota]
MAPSAVSTRDHDLPNGMRDTSTAIPRHPLGVKPSGNAYTSTVNLKDHAGAFAVLPDELLISFLEYLHVPELLRLGTACKALYAFTSAEELWRAAFLELHPEQFEWRGNWRWTCLGLPPERRTRIDCRGLFSDALYRPFFCAYTPLNQYAADIPTENRIARLDDLTSEEFHDQWINKPFILTKPVTEWPVYRDWTVEALLRDHAETKFRAEAVDWPLRTYFSYLENSHEESPLYLFDRGFAEKMQVKIGRASEDAIYWPPDCFGEDLFSVLGEQRPDSKWLIIGPARSGSTFHKDPNGTSAWNAVLTGSKYWIMFPSSPTLPPPPGVILSADQSEITSPLSIAEYLLSFHEIARSTPGCREGICNAGEVLHVPSGWFHLVLNLDASIAITQNFVPQKKLPDVLAFLKDSPDQVSGFTDDVEDPYGLFVERLREQYPSLLEEAFKVMERRGKEHKSKWEQLVKKPDEGDQEAGGFSFGFGGDEDEDE